MLEEANELVQSTRASAAQDKERALAELQAQHKAAVDQLFAQAYDGQAMLSAERDRALMAAEQQRQAAVAELNAKIAQLKENVIAAEQSADHLTGGKSDAGAEGAGAAQLQALRRALLGRFDAERAAVVAVLGLAALHEPDLAISATRFASGRAEETMRAAEAAAATLAGQGADPAPRGQTARTVAIRAH